MSISRVAIIFDDQVRPDTTGVYCRRALESLATVDHVSPATASAVSRGVYDLYLVIDDGLEYQLPADLHPIAWWAIDTHLNFDRYAAQAPAFDLVFTAQRDGAEQLRRAGIGTATWLPLACDPTIHRKHSVEKTLDVAFVGHVFPGPRADLLKRMQERFPNSFVGERYFDEMARTYSASRIVFNRSIRNDVNMRVFEAVGCGSLLLTNGLKDNGQEELFREGVHLVTYGDAEELLDKIAFYLKDEELRERIALAGHREALARHTYRHRMEAILRQADAMLSRTTAQVPEGVPFGSTDSAPRDRSYFEFDRPELLGLVPKTASKILDIGCGAGRLGASLKRRQSAEVTGIEQDKSASSLAAKSLDQVLVGDIEKMELPFNARSFDAIICGDVLEHLLDPARLLRRAREWLKPDGRLIASIPNVRHHSVVLALLEGNWTYQSAGLLDRTHRVFFTRREIEKLFYRAGFVIEQLSFVPSPDFKAAVQQGGELKDLYIDRLCLGKVPPKEAEEFFAYQYLVSAVRSPVPAYGLTSIVIVTCNQLSYTRQCLQSIWDLTDEPYEVIIVDNASTDGTVEYVRSLPEVTLITNTENRGFPAGANQGIRAARGEHILLLNNDCIVTTGWLGRLLNALHSDPNVGLAGPCSNFVSGAQQVRVPYTDLLSLDGFAWDWANANRSVLEPTDRLVGFCLLIRREVIEAVGLLDEGYGLGWFDDDDFCLRAIRAGYRAVIVRDAFVHHFGGRTFIANGIDCAALVRANQERFRAKWQDEPPAAGTPAPDASGKAEEAEVRSTDQAAAGNIRLSLCMIVRDSSRTLAACLESIRPWVDEMVVVDTGSGDNTCEIAERFGTRVFHFPWCDDFSAARNESIKHARGSWVFWMDSDDTIDAVNGRKLRELAQREPPQSGLGYLMQVHCPAPSDDGSPNITAVDHVKLFRNLPELRFKGRIHEQVLMAIRRAGGSVAWTDLFVVHSGSDQSPEGRRRKQERDLKLLELENQDWPDHPFTLFNLGMTYADMDEYERAIAFLVRSIERSGPDESHLRKAYALLAQAYKRSSSPERAWEVCQVGLARFPRDAELLFRAAVLLAEQGRLREAADTYETLLAIRGQRHLSSVDKGIRSFRARHNLAIVYRQLGDGSRAEALWRSVVAEVPRYRPAWRGLAHLLLVQGRLEEAGALADRLIGEEWLRTEGRLLKAHVGIAREDLSGACQELRAAVAETSCDPEPLRMLCQLLFDHGDPAEAKRALSVLLTQNPSDAAGYYNLGTACLRLGQLDEAVAAYQKSLELRPQSASTYLHLGYAFEQLGRAEEATAAWEACLRIEPDNQAARKALGETDAPSA